ncbi:acyl-CoA thioesterase [Pendulispora albinea]|uniref:Acyl-CoA thioesterase n=1 Tax=Pendulispora albinea TaxID=2741071 RepID=A0ABZ2LTF0_9BACT
MAHDPHDSPALRLEDFPFRTHDTIRYGDTDRQGHVNNAAFATFCETGRVAFLHLTEQSLAHPGTSFVIARLVLDFRAEITWPGTVDIGTRLTKVGRSSMTLEQGLFQNGRCAATSESIVVLVDDATRKSTPLLPEILRVLEARR